MLRCFLFGSKALFGIGFLPIRGIVLDIHIINGTWLPRQNAVATDSGAFDPNGTLTREQAAAIICRMLLGEDAEELTTNSVVFSDVSAGRWSAGYIGYCAQ